jgi:arylsulfatase A-like enzyme
MIIRTFLWVVWIVLALALLPRNAEGARPNIIFLLTDDQRDNSIGAMGHPFVKTPHLDSLMHESVRFTNAYTATPVCAPSRVSIFTGLPERVHGVGFSSSYRLTEEQWDRTYPALLREAGYHSGFIGKFGVEHYTFRGRAAGKFDYWWGHDEWTRFLPKTINNDATRPYHRAEEDIITLIMGEAMAEFLESAPQDKPFSLSVSFNVPHGSQALSMADPRSMEFPANENTALKGSPFYDTLYRDIEITLPEETGTDPYLAIPKSLMNQNRGRNQLYSYNYSVETNLEHHIRYYQMITGLDHVIGGLIADLEERGLLENTIIIFTSDHGLLMGEYGMGGKELLYDLAAKVPLLIYDPRLPSERRGLQLDQIVSTIDLTRTMLDYAGLDAPAEMEGQSLRPLVEGSDVPWRDEMFLESLFSLRDNPFQEGIRTERWKYIRFYKGKVNFLEADLDFTGRSPALEMLFDLEADPGERNNLVADPDHSEILAQLRARTAAESKAINQRRDAYMENIRVESRFPR